MLVELGSQRESPPIDSGSSMMRVKMAFMSVKDAMGGSAPLEVAHKWKEKLSRSREIKLSGQPEVAAVTPVPENTDSDSDSDSFISDVSTVEPDGCPGAHITSEDMT